MIRFFRIILSGTHSVVGHLFNTSPDLEFLANTTSSVSVCAAHITSVYVYVRVCACISVIPTGWQVDKGENVVLDEAGEAHEDRVEEETHVTQTLVQCPLVEVDSHDLDTQTGRLIIRQIEREKIIDFHNNVGIYNFNFLNTINNVVIASFITAAFYCVICDW